MTSLSLLIIRVSVNCDISELSFHFVKDNNVSQNYVPPKTFPKQKILEMKNRDDKLN